jgi:hypothetical protein
VAAQLYRTDDGDYTRLQTGGISVNAQNLGVGLGAANKGDMQGLRQYNIIAKTGASAYKRAILPAQRGIHFIDGLSAVAVSQ